MRVSEEVLADACLNGGHNVHGLTPNQKCDLALDLRDARAALRLAVEAMVRADIHIAQVSQPDHEMLASAIAACRKVVGE